MTRSMLWTGFLATLAIMLLLGYAFLTEPFRREQTTTRLHVETLATATDLYAQNCVVCHGASGEGIGATPALSNPALREADTEDLHNVIARGRYGTAMAGWSTEEGGVLTAAQIDQMVTLIRYGDWSSVQLRVAELGLEPPVAMAVDVPAETLQTVAALPGGDVLSRGLTLYAENCVACHNAHGEGSPLAPPLNSGELRSRLTNEDLARVIAQGSPGTLMAGWGNALTEGDIADLVALIRRWPEVESAGIELPVAEMESVAITPENIAAGEQLFSLACTQCHGSVGQGTPMAPSLNNQQFLAQTPDAAIKQIIAGGVPGTAMPAWGTRLTDNDLSALVAYIRSWEPTAPPVAAPSVPASGGGGGPPWQRNP